jgi:AAA domain
MEGELQQIIPGILVEGINMTGACAGIGKTWFQLSQAKAVCTGQAFMGSYRVTEKVKVLYLIPEAGDHSLRSRMEKLHIAMDGEVFLVRTLKDGILDLHHPALAGAIKAGYRGVYLDTAIRFMNGDDENSSSENARGLGQALFDLRQQGALFVVGAHHSRKSFDDLTKSKDDYAVSCTLENALRGTGDIGAMCDSVIALRNASNKEGEDYILESRGLTRLSVQNVKSRDFEPAEPFVIQGKPHINESGDFKVLEGDYATVANSYERAAEIIAKDQKITVTALCKKIGASRQHFEKEKIVGWAWKQTSKTTGYWVPNSGEEPKMMDMPAF